MALTLQAMKEQTKALTLEFMGETVNLTYRPGAFTPELQRSLTEDVSASEMTSRFARYYVTLIASWDILDKPKAEGGKPWPITEEAIRELPYSLLNAIATALNEDTTVDPTKAARS